MSIARPVQGYRGLVETCRARAEELALSRHELDRLAGLPQGYCGKLLGNADTAKAPKRMWPIALESVLGALGLKIIVIEDETAAARTLALREPVDRANQRFGNVSRLSAKLLPPRSEPPALSIVQGGRKRGGGKYG
jgi:hypothetical protein